MPSHSFSKKNTFRHVLLCLLELIIVIKHEIVFRVVSYLDFVGSNKASILVRTHKVRLSLDT